MEWRFDGRGRWTAESAHLNKGAKRAATYIVNVTSDGEFTCTSNDLTVFPGGTETVATLAEAKQVCEQREAQMGKRKR